MRLPIEILIERYKDHLFAAAWSICKSAADAEDVVQDTFLQYHYSPKEYESEDHIRAWLLRVAINKAKNVRGSFWNRNRAELEDYTQTLVFEAPEDKNLFDAVNDLPENYRIVTHLFYYEDYCVKEIADMLGLSESNVKVRLSRARLILKNRLREEWNDD